MPPAARITDMHTCPMVTPGTPPVPHVGGPVITGEPTVITAFMPQARVTDKCTCVGPPDVIVKGSPTVYVGGQMAARIGDVTTHGGVITTGAPNVIIGEAGAGGPVGMSSATPGAVGAAGEGPDAIREVTRPDGSTVTEFGDNIVIEGDEDFRNATAEDLQSLAETPTGQSIIDSLQDGDKSVTIVETDRGNACGYDDPAARFANADGSPGAGTGSTVHYNPERTQIGDGSEPWMTRPPEVGLGHELVHAEQAAQGQQHPGETDGTRNRERQAVGLPPYEDNAHTENNLRRDMGEPERTYY